ncbi:MAG TPA: adenylate kinase [Candidatus Dormibacteraeota bacterium]|nr:adenylate kinase [Candidatus Dormibacteraeota bacterium]
MIGLIFGPPGSGKGTQATRIGEELHVSHLSTGEILRAEMARGSELGREVERIVAAGDLVPDELMDRVVDGRLDDAGKPPGVLLDGFPRTLEQARALEAMLARRGLKVGFLLALQAPEKTLVERLLKRAAQEGRVDDTREVIEERMREYHQRTEAVLDHYRRNGIRVLEVDGMGTADEVFERIRAVLADPQSWSSR